MDVGMIIVIIIAAVILGVGAYFQITGKKNVAKAIWAGLAAFIVAIGFANIKKLNKIKEDGQKAINNSKEEDKNRIEIVEEITDRIEKNKELLDEINEALKEDR